MTKGLMPAMAVKSYQKTESIANTIKLWQDITGVSTDPRENVSALCMFLRWNCVDHHRSIAALVRGMAAQMVALVLPPICGHADVKWTLKELVRLHGDEVETDTAMHACGSLG